jgi:hypothetical protein
VRCLILVLTICLFSVAAEAGTFYNPTGEPGIDEKGAAAAAILNEALSSAHLMYAAIERQDNDSFKTYRAKTITQLDQALAQFQALKNEMPVREIDLKPRTDSEREIINDLLTKTLPSLKLSTPKTGRDLIVIAVTMIENFKPLLDKLALERAVARSKDFDWRPVHELIRNQIELDEAGLAVSLIFSLQKK